MDNLSNNISHAIAPSMHKHLAQLGIDYDILVRPESRSLEDVANALKIPSQLFARAVVLRDGEYVCLAVLPISHMIDFTDLKTLTQHQVHPVGTRVSSDMFADCDLNTMPVLGELYQLETFYDISLFSVPSVIFEGGRHASLIRVNCTEFAKLAAKGHKAKFSSPIDTLSFYGTDIGKSISVESSSVFTTAVDFTISYRNFTPEVGQSNSDIAQLLPEKSILLADLLKIRNSGKNEADKLEAIIINDNALNHCVIPLLESPLFSSVLAKGETITKLFSDEETASNIVVNMAIGIAVQKQFKFNASGPLDFISLWQHALISTSLSIKLAQELNNQNVNYGLLCLSGLLQNTGYLLYGYLYQARYYLFNRLLKANPALQISTFESVFYFPSSVIVATNRGGNYSSVHPPESTVESAPRAPILAHSKLGLSLLSSWKMPQELLLTVEHHHDKNYCGDFSIYPNLIYIANALLHAFGIGDAKDSQLPVGLLQMLDLNETRLRQLVADSIEDFRKIVTDKTTFCPI